MRKLTSVLLSLLIIVAMMPAAFAEDTVGEAGVPGAEAAEAAEAGAPDVAEEGAGAVEAAEAGASDVAEEATEAVEAGVAEAVEEQAAAVLLPGFEAEASAGAGGSGDEDLFMGYVEKTARPVDSGKLFRGSVLARNSLNELEAAVYDALKVQVEEVAAGERKSTKFEIAFEDLGVEKTFWTAEDLGVETIDETEAVEAFYELNDMEQVVDALVSDSPYTMYWFDKLNDYKFYGFDLYEDTVDGTAGIRPAGTMEFDLPVAIEFSPDGAENGYVFDTSIAKSVAPVIDTASAIVDKYESASDYDKMDGYRREICDLVAYNEGCAHADYGNPWQLIWVFDGDDSTDVVCEGYSKAFKLLCDMSDFDNDISCLLATGTLNYGGHMWNIVSLDAGSGSLVDITNCDDDSPGMPDLLFLKHPDSGTLKRGYNFTLGEITATYRYDSEMLDLYAADYSETQQSVLALASEDMIDLLKDKCDHSLTYATHKYPRCTTDGQIEYWYCSRCKLAFADEVGEIPLTHQQTILPATGHNWVEEDVLRKATFTAAGKASCACDACGETKTKSIPKVTASLSKTSFTYTGKTQTPKIILKSGDTVLDEEDYIVSWSASSRKKVGKYTATIKLKGGRYDGKTKLSYKIVPKGTSITKLTPARKAFTVKWKKQATQTTGYQIQYNLKKSSSGAKAVKVKGARRVSRKISKLKAKKTYYVRIRTYKTVSGKNYYSSWGSWESVKTK